MEIKQTDLSYEVYKRLKTMILANEYEPGEKLVQENIATMFGISRMPLHKAFQMLESEMLIENLPRRGFYVTEIDNSILLDAFECREALEGIAASRAAQVIGVHQLQDLKDLFSPFLGKKNIDIKKYIEADQNFHNSILLTSGNKVIQRFEIIKNIISQTYRGGLLRGPEETLPEHLAIIEALAKRDAVMAEKLMRVHLVRTQERIRKQLNADKKIN